MFMVSRHKNVLKLYQMHDVDYCDSIKVTNICSNSICVSKFSQLFLNQNLVNYFLNEKEEDHPRLSDPPRMY